MQEERSLSMKSKHNPSRALAHDISMHDLDLGRSHVVKKRCPNPLRYQGRQPPSNTLSQG